MGNPGGGKIYIMPDSPYTGTNALKTFAASCRLCFTQTGEEPVYFVRTSLIYKFFISL